ncbi:hypothetical protein [Chitinophaga sp. Cy-1792]|uniref:hypothetical protein n=1 Tax=Chitinophaga sp. Cy-1792 TaxID=2608339 RepID=UPI001421D737|nr:hypothetical protein [Chitinophaga sp. Cy-1792]NIG57489.1 hypothetical protein [Chitinophaga sp. Cy-1792]
MEPSITFLLIDPNEDHRLQYYYALDLSGKSKACICQPDMNAALSYLESHPGFRPDYIFQNTAATYLDSMAFNTALQLLDGLKHTTVLHQHYNIATARNHSFPLMPQVYLLKEQLLAMFEANAAVLELQYH